jgi:hypothetical protein
MTFFDFLRLSIRTKNIIRTSMASMSNRGNNRDKSIGPGFHIWVIGGKKKYVCLSRLSACERDMTFEGFNPCNGCPYKHTSHGCPVYNNYKVIKYTREQFLELANQVQIDAEERAALSILNNPLA